MVAEMAELGQTKPFKRVDGIGFPPFTLKVLDAVLAKYPTAIGEGADDINPRSWRLLPVGTKRRLLDVMRLWEEEPLAPELAGPDSPKWGPNLCTCE